MKSLEVIALPSFRPRERDWLKQLRAARDPDKSAPRITLVFPGSDLSPRDFAAEVRQRAKGVRRIHFRLRSAVVVAEPLAQSFHVFLVPDEGCGAITRLYGKLHAGRLAPIMRTDITYLPHVTVASANNWCDAYKLATQLNAENFSIAGRLDELEVHQRDDTGFITIATIPLDKAGWLG